MSEIKRQLISGVVYNSIAKYAGIVVTLVVTGILARLFTPVEFGIVNIASVIIAFFAVFSDLGIAPAVIQHKELTQRDLDNIFSLTVWAGITISILFFFASPLIASCYEDSDTLRTVCRLLSVNLLAVTVNLVPNALILKDKRFRFIAVRSLAVQTAGGALAIGAAFAGAGIYALTINPILSGLLLFVVNYRQHPLHLRLRVEKASLRKVFSFSAFQFSFQLLNFFSRNLDKLLMGRYMSLAQLGYYDKSYRLMMLPLQNIAYVVSPVMHPVFSDLQHNPAQLESSYRKVVRLLAFVGLPLTAALWFMSEELVLLVFGGQWLPSVPAFRILALSVGVQIVSSTSGAIFQAAGDTRRLFWCGLFSAVTTISAVCIGIFASGTIEAVAWGLCVSFFVNFVQCYYTLYHSTLQLPSGPFWSTFLQPLLLTALLCVPLGILQIALPEISLIGALAVKGIVASIVWLGGIQLFGAFDLYRFIRTKILRRP